MNHHEIELLKSLTQAFNETVDTDRYELHYIGGKAGPYRGIERAIDAAKKLMGDDPTKSSIEIYRINDDDETPKYIMKVTSGGHIVRPSQDERSEINKMTHISKTKAATLYLADEPIVIQPKNYSELEQKNEARFRLKFQKNSAFPTLDAAVRHILKDYPDHKTLSFFSVEKQEPEDDDAGPKEVKPEEPAGNEEIEEAAVQSGDSCPSCGSTSVDWYVEKPEIGGLTLKCNNCGNTYTKELGVIYKPYKIVNEQRSKSSTFSKLNKTAAKITGSSGLVTLECDKASGNEFVKNLVEAVALAQRFANENSSTTQIWVEPKMLGETQSLANANVKLFGVLKPVLVRENEYHYTAKSASDQKNITGKVTATSATNAMSSIKKAIKAKNKNGKYSVTFIGPEKPVQTHNFDV